jgi:uncharacterized protein (TIGR03067 family)
VRFVRAFAVAGALLAGFSAVHLRSHRVGAGDKEEPPALSAEQFTKEYADNPAEFDRKYKGKVVTIEGVVGSTAVKLSAPADKAPGKTYLMLDGYRKPGAPVAHMVRCEESGPDFEGIRAGHKVRIRGTAQGHSDTSIAAELRDCKVVKVFAADYPPSPAARAEVKKLQGTWKVVGGESGGKKLPADQAGFDAISFEGYTALLHQGKQRLSFGLVLDPGKTPKRMDLIGKATLPCVYALDGDRLQLALPARDKDGSFTRPETLDTAQSKGHLLIAERQQ